MIKDRTTQLIFQTAFCTLGIVGVIAGIGLFEMTFRWDFYVYFTNLSNYLCLIVGISELIHTARRTEDEYMTVHPLLKFIALLGILLTFLVFNLLLAHADNRKPEANFKIDSVLAHIVLPLMYTADWVLFYKKGMVKKSWPFLSTLFPLGYLVFVYTHAALRKFDHTIMNFDRTTHLIYPYFFLDPVKVGISGVVLWCIGILVAFIAGGFILMGVDRLLMKINDQRRPSLSTQPEREEKD